MLAVTGMGSNIVGELAKMLPEEDIVRMEPPLYSGFLDAERYLLCAGVIRPKTIREQGKAEIAETLNVNMVWPIQLMDRVLETNHTARICVIGSESGTYWSHDGAYACAKSAVHQYVRTKKLKSGQQLVALAPSCIEDTGMSQGRSDLETRRKQSPKGRLLTSVEVARAIYFLLYQDRGFITGTVIPMDGGRR